MDGCPQLSVVGQLAALHKLGTNDVPADAEQSGGLNLVAMAEFVGCSCDRRIDLGVQLGSPIFKQRQ